MPTGNNDLPLNAGFMVSHHVLARLRLEVCILVYSSSLIVWPLTEPSFLY